MAAENYLNNKRIGFIGAGNMAVSIIRGLLLSKKVKSNQIYISDKNKRKQAAVKRILKVEKAKNNVDLVDLSDIVILCVKPQNIDEVLSEIKQEIDAGKIVISIAAGVKLSLLRKNLKKAKLIRIMPNVGALTQESITAVSYSRNVDSKSKKLAKSIFDAIGEVEEVDHKKMDAVTALSGSGPAYIAYVLDSLIKAAKAEGLNKHEAEHFAYQMMNGTIKLIKEKDMQLKDIIKMVTSKGGTTEAALKVFNKKKLSKIITEALKAATKRSKELSKG